MRRGEAGALYGQYMAPPVDVGHHCFNECTVESAAVPSSPSLRIRGQVYVEPVVFVVVFYLLPVINRWTSTLVADGLHRINLNHPLCTGEW